MKKLLLGLVVVSCLVFCKPCMAESLSIGDTLSKLPPLKQGIAWSIDDAKLNYLSTIEIAKWKNITFEVGYAGDAENTGNKAVAVVSYPILKLKDLGVELPVLDLIEVNVGMYAGYGRIHLAEELGEGNNEFDYGPSLTLISLKF